VLCLDAGNDKSYTGSGSTVNDLTNNYVGSLINNPSYIQNFKGGWSLNGSNQKIYTSLPANTLGNSCCVCIFCSLTNYDTTSVATSNRLITVDRSSDSTKWTIGVNRFGNFQFAGGGGPDGEPSFAVPLLQPFFIGFNLDDTSYQLYLNGVLKIADTGSPSTTSINNLAIGGRPTATDLSWIGNIHSVLIYNSPISQANIIQNYKALKGRYGL
jgi:hypothetical protein